MVYITGQSGSQMTHIINGIGSTLTSGVTTTTFNSLWLHPAFGIMPDQNGANFEIMVPTESWHSYQLQYKNQLSDPNWLNLGTVPGNDTLESITTSMPANSRFYRVKIN